MRLTEALTRIAEGEGQHDEFKESPSQLPKAIRTLAAFASQSGGGVVFIGVTDAGEPLKGFTIADNLPEKLAATIKENTVSMISGEPLYPDIYAFTAPAVVVIEVPPSQVARGPFLAYGRRWERVGKSTHEVKINYRQLARAYRDALYDPEATESLGYRFCPMCGEQRLTRAVATDHRYDMTIEIVKCSACSWSDWSE
jgi:predicted HTH transcriptional regulator